MNKKKEPDIIDAMTGRWLTNGKWIAIIIFFVVATWQIGQLISGIDKKVSESNLKIELMSKDIEYMKKDIASLLKMVEDKNGKSVSQRAFFSADIYQ